MKQTPQLSQDPVIADIQRKAVAIDDMSDEEVKDAEGRSPEAGPTPADLEPERRKPDKP